MRRSTVHTIILGCYMVVLAVLGASLWLNDERLAVIGLLAFTGLVQATPLQLQVYNPGEAAVFPVSSTLISGEREAILVDAQFSTREAAELVRLVKASGKRLTTIYISLGSNIERERHIRAGLGDNLALVWESEAVDAARQPMSTTVVELASAMIASLACLASSRLAAGLGTGLHWAAWRAVAESRSGSSRTRCGALGMVGEGCGIERNQKGMT